MKKSTNLVLEPTYLPCERDRSLASTELDSQENTGSKYRIILHPIKQSYYNHDLELQDILSFMVVCAAMEF